MNELYSQNGDTILSVYGNGFVRNNYPLYWKEKKVNYVSPQFYKNCLKDEFVIQFIKFDIYSTDSVGVSLYLAQQGSASMFFLKKEKEKWKIKTSEVEFY